MNEMREPYAYVSRLEFKMGPRRTSTVEALDTLVKILDSKLFETRAVYMRNSYSPGEEAKWGFSYLPVSEKRQILLGRDAYFNGVASDEEGLRERVKQTLSEEAVGGIMVEKMDPASGCNYAIFTITPIASDDE